MTPAEVPDDLADKVSEAICLLGAEEYSDPDLVARIALAAVLPDHRKQVIEEVATAVERPDSRRFPGRGWDYQYAAALRNYAHEDE